MSLRKQLADVLPRYLPSDPAKAIKGTDLIRLTRRELLGNFSDASLRYHFSIMCCDPASPIAKVEKGQGYYRRGASMPALSGARELISMTQGRLDDLAGDRGLVDQAMLRARKFRAIVTRYFETNGRFPFIFRDAFAHDSPLGNLWKYPDLVLVDWETGLPPEEEMELAAEMLRLKQRLGLPPFRLLSARLRLQSTLQTYREDIFQTLAVAGCTQGADLIYACPITDEALADGLRRLAVAHGIGVISFGLDLARLDELPRPSHILHAQPRETEAVMESLDIHRFATPRMTSHIDWSALSALHAESAEAAQLLAWLERCITERKAEPFRNSV